MCYPFWSPQRWLQHLSGSHNPKRECASFPLGDLGLWGLLLMLGGCTAAPAAMMPVNATDLADRPVATTRDLSGDAGGKTAIAVLPAATLLAQAFDASDQIARVNQTAITIYQVDTQCQSYVSQRIQVNRQTPVQAAVGHILMTQDVAGFEVAGYRVSVDDKKHEATVDLRLMSTSPRPMTALSICEQMALFGSLRQTLLQNDDWNIQSVRFLERGQEIVF